MTADVALAARGRFTGDPSHEYEHTETSTEGEGDEATVVEVTVRGGTIGIHDTDGPMRKKENRFNKINKSPSWFIWCIGTS